MTPRSRGLWRSPFVLVTAAAIAVGLGVAAVAVVGQPSATSAPPLASPGSSLVVPAVLTPKALTDGRAVGRPDAPATLTVWEDFQCPICGEFTRQVEPKLYRDFVVPGKLRIVYRDFAFVGQESLNAGAAARCAGDQGAFWPYHDYLFWNQGTENGGAFGRTRLDAIADAVGLDRGRFDACLAAGQELDRVKSETTAGQQAGIGETPTLVVDKSVMPGSPASDQQYLGLSNVIEASIAAHSSASP